MQADVKTRFNVGGTAITTRGTRRLQQRALKQEIIQNVTRKRTELQDHLERPSPRTLGDTSATGQLGTVDNIRAGQQPPHGCGGTTNGHPEIVEEGALKRESRHTLVVVSKQDGRRATTTGQMEVSHRVAHMAAR
jgi:hypothetical protein